MAVGQPATGIGGMFYIILMLGILINKALRKIVSRLNLNSPQNAIKIMKQRLPTLALVVSSILLLYVNLSGFRLVAFFGAGKTSTPTIDLWITGPSAVSVFLLVVLLFYRKARQNQKV